MANKLNKIMKNKWKNKHCKLSPVSETREPAQLLTEKQQTQLLPSAAVTTALDSFHLRLSSQQECRKSTQAKLITFDQQIVSLQLRAFLLEETHLW